ncbi:MAG: OmpA family protein [Candidatus Kapabacteria bacterium]|nr:OmpA family protein [Candidatus Kapabacteria bacterium]
MKKIILILILFLSYSGFSQKIEITPLEINSSRDDFNSAITQNSRVIYFTSERKGRQQYVYMTQRTASGWSNPEMLNSEINSGDEIGAVTLTPDGQFMIFSAFNHPKLGQGRTDLYSAKKIDGDWTAVRNLGPMINSDYWDSQPCLTSDGNTLYFVSDRPGGFGGTDIYVSRKTRDGWSRPENLGPTVNSSYDEMSPVIGSDNKSLTFASNKPGGYGGFDIYFTKLTNNNFSTPRNAGEPINSSADEYYYYSLPNSKYAYFSSDRSGGEGALDIYMAFPNPFASESVVLVSGTVSDALTKFPLGADITVTDLGSRTKVAEMRSDDKSGLYYVVLQPGKVYSITASKKGYVFYSDRIQIPTNEAGHEETKDIQLYPLAQGNTRLLVFFDFDKAILKDESIPELERIIEFLRDNPNVKIQLEGHTDDVGTDEYNDKLSLNRANAVRDYLVSAGIESSRIKTAGYGKRRPLKKDTSEEARSLNRRVEMKIIE